MYKVLWPLGKSFRMLGAQNRLTYYLLVFSFLTVILASTDDLDDDDHAFHHGHDSAHETTTNRVHQSEQKDRMLLSEVKSLVFQRNKRTTSRRTHPIHQLSCVGGTAGCKLFTPDMVECENMGTKGDDKVSKINWLCHADMSDRVQFNHVEVICEGYDYPEDDYILVGSCGLEFTLDYTDPLDYHHHSYFKHLDEDEKEMHHDRVRQQMDSSKLSYNPLQQVATLMIENWLVICTFLTLLLMSFILVRYLTAHNGPHENKNQNKSKGRIVSGYGPLTSAVMTTKKAC